MYTQSVMLREDGLDIVVPFVISLHDGPVEEQENGTTLRVSLRQAGRELAAKRLPLPAPLDSDAYTLLVLTRNGDVPAFLTRSRPDISGLHVPADARPGILLNADTEGGAGITPTSDSAPTTFSFGQPHAVAVQPLTMDTPSLPADPQGYQCIDAIVFADLPLDKLTDAQTEAIKSYVRGGGLLLVSGGSDAVRLQSAFFTDLLPIVSPRTRFQPFPSALSARYDVKASKPVSLALATGSPRPSARSLFAEAPDFLPLVSVLDYGAGQVAFTAFDVFDPVLRDWPAAPALWRDLLGAGRRQTHPHEAGQDKLPALLPHALLADLEESGQAQTQQLADALAGEQANSAIHPLTLFGFFAAYTLLAPATFALLKRRDRPEWAWLVVPAAALGFILVAAAIVVRVKGGRLTANRAMIVETTANSNQAAGYARVTLYAARRGAYDITFADLSGKAGTATPREVWPSEGRSGTTGDLAITATPDAATIRGAGIGRWQTRSFEALVPVSIGSGVSAQRRSLFGDRIQFTITNNTPYTLRACAVLSPAGAAGIDDLAPGQTRSTITGESDNPATGNIRLSPAAFGTRMQFNMARGLAEALGLGPEAESGSGAADAAKFGRGAYALLGWFADPLVKVRVDGSDAPGGSEMNLLFVRLPAPSNVIPVPTRPNQNASGSAAGTRTGREQGEMLITRDADAAGPLDTKRLFMRAARGRQP